MSTQSATLIKDNMHYSFLLLLCQQHVYVVFGFVSLPLFYPLGGSSLH